MKTRCYVGSIVQRAMAQDREPLSYMIAQGYTAFTQLDVCYPPAVCIWPQFEAIEELTNAYPEAYYIHTRRITVDVHVASLTAWAPTNPFIERLKRTGFLNTFPSQSRNETDVENLKHFVREVTRRTVQFFSKRPWLNFLDMAIEDPSGGEKLSKLLGWPNFTLPRSNVGQYQGAASASPTPANLLWRGADDYEDDAAGGSAKQAHPLQPAHDVVEEVDDGEDAGKEGNGSGKGGKEGKGSGKGITTARSSSKPLPALPYSCAQSGVDLPSLLLGMLIASCLFGALRVCQAPKRPQKSSGRRGATDKRDVKYSPLPASDGPHGLELASTRFARPSLVGSPDDADRTRALWEEHEQEYDLDDGDDEFGPLHDGEDGDGEAGQWVGGGDHESTLVERQD